MFEQDNVNNKIPKWQEIRKTYENSSETLRKWNKYQVLEHLVATGCISQRISEKQKEDLEYLEFRNTEDLLSIFTIFAVRHNGLGSAENRKRRKIRMGSLGLMIEKQNPTACNAPGFSSFQINIPVSEVFLESDLEIDRDVNGARNILLKQW
ncbi:10241_t:CDS:2, partial [Gigaspora rosea]